MRKRKVQVKTLFVLVGTLVAVASVLLSAASAKPQGPAGQPADAVLIWNANAVKAVRASTPTKVQTDGMVYMSYVQAAVYDAVTKLEGRYQPYHDFAFAVVPDASVQAAVAAAARTTLDYYLPDQQPTVDGEYSTYISTLSGDVADGVALGEAAAHDLIAFRAGDGLNAATPSYGGIGPILPGQWQLQPGQAVQTPWLATMRPFFLEQASQFRVGPPPALTSAQYAKDLNETKAYGALNSSVRTPEQTAIAYFWVGNNINQYNQTMQNVVTQHIWTSSTPRIYLRWERSSPPTRGSRALTRSSSTSSGGRSRPSGTPTRTAIQTRQLTRPGSRYLGCRAIPNTPPSMAASLPPSPTPSRQRSTQITSMSPCQEERTGAACSRPHSTSTRSPISRTRSSTRGSGSASTSATR